MEVVDFRSAVCALRYREPPVLVLRVQKKKRKENNFVCLAFFLINFGDDVL